MTSFYFIF